MYEDTSITSEYIPHPCQGCEDFEPETNGCKSKGGCANTVRLQENELYQELTLHVGDKQIGEAEVDLKNKMISRLVIYDPEQNKGYGTEVVRRLIDKYGCNCLWVVTDNDKAIHVYENQGFKKVKPTMYLMER